MARATPTTDPWHFARPELADRYLRTFDVGLISARALFAKRRMGKSEFLEQDLIPAARAAGYVTVYLNLWDARNGPASAILAALMRALRPRGLGRLTRSLRQPLKRVKASAKLGLLAEGSLEADLASAATAVAPSITELIRSFDRPGRNMLLILDEAQVLAVPDNSDLAHSLRASLDGRKQNIKVVFAGSSEATLRRMFGRSTEPFYNWAPVEPFELLGAEFVQAMMAKVNRLSKYPLSSHDAMTAFDALKRTPEFFRRYLNRYLAYADLGAGAALLDSQAHVFNDANFAGSWVRMLPADREILRLIVSGVTDLFSEASRRRLAEALGLKGSVSKNVPQQSLRRLGEADIVLRMDFGDYRVQDDAFAEWVRLRELEG